MIHFSAMSAIYAWRGLRKDTKVSARTGPDGDLVAAFYIHRELRDLASALIKRRLLASDASNSVHRATVSYLRSAVDVLTTSAARITCTKHLSQKKPDNTLTYTMTSGHRT